jgi:hypothetical protein
MNMSPTALAQGLNSEKIGGVMKLLISLVFNEKGQNQRPAPLRFCWPLTPGSSKKIFMQEGKLWRKRCSARKNFIVRSTHLNPVYIVESET